MSGWEDRITWSGERLTLAVLRELLEKTADLPPETEVVVRHSESQRDGSWTTLAVERGRPAGGGR